MPRERMIVDALTNMHGNSFTMLRLLRDGVLSIVDEDRQLANGKAYREKHLRPHRQVEPTQNVEWDRRNAVDSSHTIKVDETSYSDTRAEFVCWSRTSAFVFAAVWAQACGLRAPKHVRHYRAFLGLEASPIVPLFALVF